MVKKAREIRCFISKIVHLCYNLDRKEVLLFVLMFQLQKDTLILGVFKMIDIHSHIIPFVDDGPPDWDIAIQMAKQAYADGIRGIVATPHHKSGRYINPGHEVVQWVGLLNEKIQEMNMDLVVFTGQEVRVHAELLASLRNGDLLNLHESRYMLLELPSTSVPTYAEDIVYELSLLGIQAIIAHPERNAEIANNPMLLSRLIEAGALSQITAQSITGHFGRKLQKISLHLCKLNAVHFVATDAHDPVKRVFCLSECYHYIERKLGVEWIHYFKGNAEKVINDEPIHQPRDQIKEKRSGLYSNFLGKFR